MENTEKEVIEKLISRLDRIDKDRAIYNWVSIILSILDVVCGIVCIIYSSIVIASTVVSLITGIIIGGRTVQIIKTERLAKTLGVVLKQTWVRRVFLLCISFLSIRIKRSNKKMAKWIKANKWSILSAFCACIISATAVWFVMAMYWVGGPLWAEILITSISGCLSMVLVYLLGAETVLKFTLRKAADKLPTEKVETLTNLANGMFAEIEKAKALEAEKLKKEKELEQAKQTIEAYEKAKQIVAENQNQG